MFSERLKRALEHGVKKDEQREEEQSEADDEPGPVALDSGGAVGGSVGGLVQVD
jgi:hypothetical protein